MSTSCKSCGCPCDSLRCASCYRKFRTWLAGGDTYSPRFDGVCTEPDPGLPLDRLTRALSNSHADR